MLLQPEDLSAGAQEKLGASKISQRSRLSRESKSQSNGLAREPPRLLESLPTKISGSGRAQPRAPVDPQCQTAGAFCGTDLDEGPSNLSIALKFLLTLFSADCKDGRLNALSTLPHHLLRGGSDCKDGRVKSRLCSDFQGFCSASRDCKDGRVKTK